MIEDIIQQLHDDIHGILLNDPGCQFVSIHRSRTPLEKDEAGEPIVGQTAMFEEAVENALAGITQRNGKAGLVAVVMLPDVQLVSAESPGPAMRFLPVVRVIEDRMFNEGPEGTGITASQFALHVVQLLHRRPMRGAWTMFADPERVIEEVTADDERPMQEVRFRLERSVTKLPRCAPPAGAFNDDVLTVTCATEDAQIWWTDDGSWPGPENPRSHLYEDTLTNVGSSVRVVAYHPEMAPSHDVTIEQE